MAGSGLPSLGRVKLTDLVSCEGQPSDSYKLSVSTLSQLLAQYFKGQSLATIIIIFLKEEFGYKLGCSQWLLFSLISFYRL